MNSKMENSKKEKIDREDVAVKEEVVEKVTKTERETPDGTVETETKVDVEEVVSAGVESGTKAGETVAAEEVIETKKEVVATSDGTAVEKEAEKVTLVSDQASADGVSGRAEVAEEKTEEVAAAVSDSAPKKLEAAALPTSGTKVGESSGVSQENLGTNRGGGNQETSEIPRGTENQQFVDATPRTQTSWTNCCGLFDLLKR